ncbi:MAG: cupin domain-containing protein [Paracoccaceae bacterium]|nr:cupin domain-containing protein [Paracoccaceae bacterium]
MNVVLFSSEGAAITRSPPADIVISGSGASQLWQAVQFNGGTVSAGVWVGQPGSLRVRPRAHHEIFSVTAGLIRLEAEDGSTYRIGPGESAYIPKGWSGIWQTVQPTTKHYTLIVEGVAGE